jgi:hypothetical protein
MFRKIIAVYYENYKKYIDYLNKMKRLLMLELI